MNKYSPHDHCFIICAYEKNQFLEDCLKSLLLQDIKTNIYIETSTPNNHINSIAKKYNIETIINQGKQGCAQDWNYAFNSVPYKLITIAHQDDLYYPIYTKKILEYANLSNNPLLIYTDYEEIRNNKTIKRNKLLLIKRMLNSHMKNKKNWGDLKSKRKVLQLGNAISCPTVTLVKQFGNNNPYDETYKCSCDYKTWVNLSKKEGDFVYIPEILMGHRIYNESHTSKYIEDNIRQREDSKIISSFWPYPLNKIIYYFYSKSIHSNKL